MDVASAYSALHTALIIGQQYSFVPFLQILIEYLRPDIVDKKNRVKPTSAQDMYNDYDFIIIGGGSAGSVLANRLTENTSTTVLLLETGKDETLMADVPGLRQALAGTDMEYSFQTEPSTEYCIGLADNQCPWTRGRGLGGSSMHNGMLYVRGNKRDYDHWRDLGNPGWGYEDVLPYFKKSQDMRITDLQESPYHATGGYLTVENFKYYPPLTEHFLEAGRDMGYNQIDVNGATQAGFTYSPGTIRDGLRCSTAKAFLRSASHRENLHVSTESMVVKILVDATTKKAYGVQFRQGGRTYSVSATKEVILSAGAIHSPQILLLSGIGPKEHLEEVGIQVIHDSPGVGQNLQDHVAVESFYSTDEPWTCEEPTKADSACSATAAKSGAEKFLEEQSGALYGVPRDTAVAFLNSKYANITLDHPDVELGFDAVANSAGAGYCGKQYQSGKNSLFGSQAQDHGENFTFILTTFVLRPESRGYIKLRDANPDSPPVIVPNYFHEPRDLDVLVDACKIAYNLTQTPTMKKINARLNLNAVPECAHFSSTSDDFWQCVIRYQTSTASHPTCSCKMGPADDVMAVVDPQLRVYGVSNLRVVDASIMPNIISGHTNAPTIMIAEKAADFIKEDYNLEEKKQETKTESIVYKKEEISKKVEVKTKVLKTEA